ncbi:MAG: PDZ domain-containing protein, partial [Clostridiaceae bacterium]
FGTRDGVNLTIGNIHSRNSLIEMEGTANTSKIKTIFVASPVYGGNDGGICITVDGEYIGLVNEKLSSLIGHNNLSAVIPHDELKTICDKIIKKLSQTTYSLGVTGRTIYYEPLRKNVYYILGVNEGSTAHRGGLLPTDIILKIDGKDVDPNDNIDMPLVGKKVGDPITVEILRMDKTMKMTMKVY